MRRDDRDDPFEQFFEEFERMIEEAFGEGTSFHFESMAETKPETHADIYEEDDQIRVVADLPGVEKADIDISCDGQVVYVVAESERRSYDERIRLPQRVDPSSGSASYNNGVLEIEFDTASTGESITID